MSKNKQQDPQQTLKVENYEFEPIKGYPMLNWKGKRPFTSTQYFPAQLKESYGKPDANGWMNKIFWGDNLQVMSHLLKEYRGKVDLIYIDPPFDSGADYKKKVSLKKNLKLTNDYNSFEEKQYSDLWSHDSYLQFIYDRLVLMRELLSEKGTIWLHCDWRKSHHLRLILDEVFGVGAFRCHVVWRTMTSSGYKGKTSLGRSSNDLFYYSKTSDEFTYNPIYLPMTDNMRSRYIHKDPDGRLFKDSYLGDATKETIEELRKENRLYVTKNGGHRIKHYLDEAKGLLVDNIWTDIDPENSQSETQTGYPTQKPEELLERIINMTSNPGDIVFDCFMGSGTTQVVASKLDRRFIGADINLGAIDTAKKRLLSSGNNGFEVYSVNNYDVFRNTVEAKQIIADVFEVSKINNSIYDGEKDGRMVKIMPVNRIASKGDLTDLIAGFDYKSFEKRQKENPNKPVEKILLVCMGHEPDLKAHLEKEVSYKLDVEIVDILRDKQDLQFKRESEAKIKIKKGKLVIEKFYPMNLLQKLSLQKEKVSDWKELVESVLIDWNYDGAVLEPQVIDIPEKNELVAGEYEVPKDAGTIRVKITDLLSESIEIEVSGE